jgi:hypothetical protein
MTTLATSASVQFAVNGPAGVCARLHLTGRTFMNCHTYDDRSPILAIDDAHVQVSIAVPDTRRVTEEDMAVARQLAKVVSQYVAELEQLAGADRQSPEACEPGAAPGRAA